MYVHRKRHVRVYLDVPKVKATHVAVQFSSR